MPRAGPLIHALTGFRIQYLYVAVTEERRRGGRRA